MLQIDEMISELEEISEKFKANWNTLKMDQQKEKILDLERRMEAPDFWDRPDEANQLNRELATLKRLYEDWESLKKQIQNLFEIFEMLKEEEDAGLLEEAALEFEVIQKEFKNKELYLYFRGKFDTASAYLSINAGAGGTESNDWVSILSRMYLRWAELSGLETEIVDELPGEEAGIKNITIFMKGLHAYGNLRGEAGVHRLVRISPFDSNARRHTSFASVSIFPEIEEELEVEINPADLKVDTYRAGGAGGQHVNKTESAVKVIHIPTGMTVYCQDDRSQHKNREKAMRILKSKLKEKQEREQKESVDSARRSQIGSGERSEKIRTYNYPQNRITDHRINATLYNLDYFMDGAMDELLDKLSTADKEEILERYLALQKTKK